MNKDLRATCVSNNADLYDAISRHHHLTHTRTKHVWHSCEIMPPYYSNVLLLEASGTHELLRQIVATRSTLAAPFTVKDGFCAIDGRAENFELLFSATWIAGDFTERPAPWSRLETAEMLAAWERAWSKTSPAQSSVFPKSCLDDPKLAFFGKVSGREFVSGCLINQSKDCVGLSNVFGQFYEQAVACAASIARGKPIVGYERGVELENAFAAGFDEVGPLNIWSVS